MNFATDMASVCKGLEASETISEDVISRTVDLVTVVVTSMYCRETFANLDALRYYLYARRKSLENLPLTADALRQHVLPSLYQTRTWVQAVQPVPAILEPFHFGWKNDASGPTPSLTTKTNIPEHLRTASFCKCKKGCTRNCLCKGKGIDCEAACHCKGAEQTCARAQFQEETDSENAVAYIKSVSPVGKCMNVYFCT